MTVECPRQPQGPRQGRRSAEKSGRMEQVLTRKSISKDQLRKSNDSTHLRERMKDSMYICVYANSTSRLAVLHNRYYTAFGSFCAWRGFWTQFLNRVSPSPHEREVPSSTTCICNLWMERYKPNIYASWGRTVGHHHRSSAYLEIISKNIITTLSVLTLEIVFALLAFPVC